MTELNISTAAGVFDAIVEGPPEGRPVLLLHGFPQTGLAWLRQIAALAAHGYRVLAPNQRGYSPASAPSGPEGYHISTLVDDVVAITDELGWATFDLVGHDWGGAVAWWTADAHPGRVRTLTVVSTPHPGALADSLRTDENQRNRSRYMIDWRETPRPRMTCSPMAPKSCAPSTPVGSRRPASTPTYGTCPSRALSPRR